jgi:hypothetical protein
MSVPSKGNSLPKMGSELPIGGRRSNPKWASEVAEALKLELGGSNRSIKTLMKWTGASERTAKAWLAGSCVPTGEYLILLLHHSDSLFERVLMLAGRESIDKKHLASLQSALSGAVSAIDGVLGRDDLAGHPGETSFDDEEVVD